MGVNSLPKTVTRQHCGCDLNPGSTVPESSTLTTQLPMTITNVWRHTDVYSAWSLMTSLTSLACSKWCNRSARMPKTTSVNRKNPMRFMERWRVGVGWLSHSAYWALTPVSDCVKRPHISLPRPPYSGLTDLRPAGGWAAKLNNVGPSVVCLPGLWQLSS